MKRYDIAAYIWPSYTGDEIRTRIFWPEGMGEWQTVRSAQPKFEGHAWPRKPLWGYVNEADPFVMEMQIEAAVSHGVNTFIYDWYWYDGRPFLENCLRDGFLKARNSSKMRFFLMWANHDATTLWDKRNSHDQSCPIWRGSVSRQEFENAMRHAAQHFFTQENYYRIDGKPVLMIYDVANLVNGLGGIEETRDALMWLDGLCRDMGLNGIHAQFTMWNENATRIGGLSAKEFDKLGFESMTHYQFVHFADIDRAYPEVLSDAVHEWEKLEQYPMPYYPHVSIGWDNNPRHMAFVPGIMRDVSPENFEKGLRAAKAYCDRHADQAPLITINSWNEWTEGSYLEPDDLNGYGMLEAVKRVFCETEDREEQP